MSKEALEDKRYELIKAHCLDPDSSPLSEEHQIILERWLSASKLLRKRPIMSQAAQLLRVQFPGLSRSQAYEDLRNARRLFNTLQTFDYDFWHTWLLESIAKNIQACESSGKSGDRKVIAMEHRNLINAIGERPETEVDPRLTEKHKFFIPIQINNQILNIDLEGLLKMPIASRKAITDALSSKEIDDSTAENIMNS